MHRRLSALSRLALTSASVLLLANPLDAPAAELVPVDTTPSRLSFTGPDNDPDFFAVNPAIAYNPARDEYLVVWQGFDDAAGREIFARRVSAATGALLEAEIQVSSMENGVSGGLGGFNPAVAFNPEREQFLVVWEGSDESLAPFETEIFGQRLGYSGGTLGEVGLDDFRISTMGPEGDAGFRAADPAVVFNATDEEFLVVWEAADDGLGQVENEIEIFGQRFGYLVGGAFAPQGALIRVSSMGRLGDAAFGAEEPAVAYDRLTNGYVVAWSGNPGTGDLGDAEREIFAQRLSASGALVAPIAFRVSEMGVDGASFDRAREVSVAFNEALGRFLFAWSGQDSANDDDGQIYVQLTTASLSPVFDDQRISDLTGPGQDGFGAFRPSVLPLGEEGWLVVWDGADDRPDQVADELEIFAQRLTPTAAQEGVDDQRLSTAGTPGSADFFAFGPVLAARTGTPEVLAAWSATGSGLAGVDPDKLEVFGARLTTPLFADGFESGNLSGWSSVVP